MKYGILGCILFLILVGTASAIAVNPPSVKATIQAPSIVPVPLPGTAAITFDSNMPGATVYLDGNLLGADSAHSRTPVTAPAVSAGDHTATFTLAGYQDTVMSFHVDAGKAQTIYARLQPSPVAGTVRQVQPEGTLVRIPVTGIQQGAVTTTIPPTFTTTRPAAEKIVSVLPAATVQDQIGGGPESGKGDEGRGLPEGPIVPVATIQTVGTSPGLFDQLFGGFFSGLFGKPVPKPPVNATFTGPTIPPGTSFNLDSYTVAPVIDKGATIYIGEEKLDVTHALNQARGTTTAAENGAVPALTVIGYWITPSQVFTTAPSKKIDLGTGSRYKSMTVNPADFVGYTGDWYLLNASGIKPYSTSSVVFSVRDPALDLSVINAATQGSVEGTPVTKGTQLRFSITKNIAVRNPMGIADLRSPLSGTRDDGFLDIVVTDPAGNRLTELAVTTDAGSKTTESLRKSCWESTLIAPDCKPAYAWDTGATQSGGTAKYPSGTYSVQVISKLNNMHNDYKNAGQPYTGKTVSRTITFTLV